MKFEQEEKLDNPVWFSLNESHEIFSRNYGALKCYNPDCCPFGGFKNNSTIANEIDRYAETIKNFYIVGDKPDYNNGLILKNELVCLQMMLSQKIDLQIHEEIVKLNGAHEEELYNLVNFVQPGYFMTGTSALGDYYGIFKDGQLVAVAGERMQMNNFVEISAIVTHPDHVGRGYAKQLIAYITGKIFTSQKIPYLHVAESNLYAIKLYEKYGFVTRRKISFWNFVH